MNIDASQYQKIVEAAFGAPADNSAHELAPAEAELIVAIAQLAVAADRVDDPDERALFETICGLLYKHANVETTAPTLAPLDDDEQRIDHMKSHAAQLVGKPAAGLAFAVAYVLVIADMQLAPEEGALLEALREALGIDEARAEDLSGAVGEAITPPE